MIDYSGGPYHLGDAVYTELNGEVLTGRVVVSRRSEGMIGVEFDEECTNFEGHSLAGSVKSDRGWWFYDNTEYQKEILYHLKEDELVQDDSDLCKYLDMFC